jgi:hypothetical protein
MGLTIYPVPNEGEFSVVARTPETVQITIHLVNVLGQSVYDYSGHTNEVNNLHLKTASGVYTLLVTGDNFQMRRMVIIK